MYKIVLLMSAIVLSTSGQYLVQPVAHVVQPAVAAHPAVVANAAWEQQLHPDLLKSAPFYGNPRTAQVLAHESWLTDKESPVYARKAEEIDRSQVTKILGNAGLHKRK